MAYDIYAEFERNKKIYCSEMKDRMMQYLQPGNEHYNEMRDVLEYMIGQIAYHKNIEIPKVVRGVEKFANSVAMEIAIQKYGDI